MLRVHCAVPEIRTGHPISYLHRVTAVIARGKRPVPFRTRKLSPSAPMVLHSPGCGRVGRRRTSFRKSHPYGVALSVCPAPFVQPCLRGPVCLALPSRLIVDESRRDERRTRTGVHALRRRASRPTSPEPSATHPRTSTRRDTHPSTSPEHKQAPRWQGFVPEPAQGACGLRVPGFRRRCVQCAPWRCPGQKPRLDGAGSRPDPWRSDSAAGASAPAGTRDERSWSGDGVDASRCLTNARGAGRAPTRG